MLRLNSLSLQNKLRILVIIPLVGMLWFSVQLIIQKYDLSHDMASLQQFAELSVKASALVHETQKERGYTAGFVASKGKKFGTKLQSQRNLTNIKQADLNQLLETFELSDSNVEFKDALNLALKALGQLEEKRSAIDSHRIETSAAIGYFTSINAKFFRCD